MATGDGKDGGLIGNFKEVMSQMTTMDGLKKTILEVEEAAYGIAKNFSLGAQNIDLMRAGLADAASDIKRLGGEFQDVIDTQKAAYTSLGRNVTLTADGMKDLFATAEATGQSSETLVKNFKDIGVGTYDIAKNMEVVLQAARDIGVNGKAVTDQVLSNMDLMNKYNFQGGVEGLAKMAAQAVNLRVNVSDMKNTISKAFDPEQAIQLASKMQMLGAQQSDLLDPLRLMDLAQNDPGELMNQVGELGKQFVQFNEEAGKFEIAPGGKRQMMELEKELGLGEGTLSRMALAGAELDDKLSKISFPTDIADEDTQKMIANMAEMKDGQYMIKFKDEKGVTQEKNVTELKPEDIEAITKTQAEAPKTMEEIAESQLSTSESMLAELQSMNRAGYGLAGSKGAGDVLQSLRAGTKVVAGGIRDIQGESQDFRKGTDKVLLENIDAVNKAMSGEGSLNDVLKTATTSVGGITTALKDNFTVAITNAKDEMDKFSKSGNMFAETLKASYDASTKYIQEHEKLSNLGINIAPEEKKTESVTTETSTIKVKDFYIATLPEDKLVMAGGTNLDGNNQTQNNSPTDLNVKVDLNVSAPPNIDTSQLLAMFKNDIRIQQAIVDATQEAYSSGGGMSPNNPNAKNKSIVNRAIGMYNE
jgi:hypothetical protein